jgi:prepilin-type N-terminal cleavage/methylation domain-containing protein
MSRKGSEKGFSLIEAIISTAIFAAVASATFSMLMMSYYTLRANSLDTHAVTLATQEREDLRSLQYMVIATRDPYTTASPNLFNGTPFTVHSEVLADQPTANMKTVTITVSWSYLGKARNYRIQTLYTNVNG